MDGFIRDLETRREKAKKLGGQDKIDLQHSFGRYTARERIEKLVDPGTFLEFGRFTCSEVPGLEEKTSGDGVICKEIFIWLKRS